jgi:hypothetical protein
MITQKRNAQKCKPKRVPRVETSNNNNNNNPKRNPKKVDKKII